MPANKVSELSLFEREKGGWVDGRKEGENTLLLAKSHYFVCMQLTSEPH